MMNHKFDPYDMLVNLNERLNRLEHAHNKLATAYSKAETDLNIVMHNYRNLQKSHLALSEAVLADQLARVTQNN